MRANGSISFRNGSVSSTVLFEGLNAEEDAAMLRHERVRKRDVVLRQLEHPTPDAAFELGTIAFF